MLSVFHVRKVSDLVHRQSKLGCVFDSESILSTLASRHKLCKGRHHQALTASHISPSGHLTFEIAVINWLPDSSIAIILVIYFCRTEISPVVQLARETWESLYIKSRFCKLEIAFSDHRLLTLSLLERVSSIYIRSILATPLTLLWNPTVEETWCSCIWHLRMDKNVERLLECYPIRLWRKQIFSICFFPYIFLYLINDKWRSFRKNVFTQS